MKLGVVGVEEAKLTPATRKKAIQTVKDLVKAHGATCIVSGECHLGGVDIIARDVAQELGLEYEGYPPKTHNWSNGYRPRNLQIAQESDAVVCITVKELPTSYSGMRLNLCYHCGTNDHVKSGGCWTTKHARRMGKAGWTVVL